MSSTISLREWIVIERALEATDIPCLANDDWSSGIRRSLAVSPDSYLMSALQVARSLADLCCDADKNIGGRRPLLPTPGTDWADQVVVHYLDLQPLPISWQNPSSDPKELQVMLNSIIPDHSVYTTNDAEEGTPTSGANEANGIPHHNEASAEFSPYPCDKLDSHESGNKLGSHDGEMQRIHNLGLVFYELFLGGERPPATKAHVDTFGCMGINNSVNRADFDAETLPHNLALDLNLSERLSIFDGISCMGDLSVNSGDSRQPLDITEKNIMAKKKRATPMSCTLSSISIEQLMRKGLPVSLCNLIGNMIDSMNGDVSGDESYRTMSDVRCDLQLMLDKPDRFLHDMDLEKLAVTGLQLNEAVFGREMDFSALQDSYMRSISGVNECGVIVGPSGIGKSVLANRLGSFASATGALFLTGKFDQLQQMTPYSALASAFNEYCDRMSMEGQSRNLQQVASKLRIELGGEARYLVKVIPNLGFILGESADQDQGQDCANAQSRIQYLLCQFVDVISSSSGAPIVLFLDNLQWSDQASLSAINQLLLFVRHSVPTSKRQFFFLGSCRDEGLLEKHPFGSMLAKIREFDVHATVVKLDCIDKDTTNTMVSDLLCLSPRLTRTLSDIVYYKSQGNPLFFCQLMISLYRDGLVWLSLKRRRWEWDEEKIQSIRLPDNVAAYLSATIEKLPKEVQGALCTLSCFGTRSDCVLIEALESKLDTPLTEPLRVAIAEGIIDKINGSYSFGHDKLQEAAYNLIQPEDRCLFHSKYGLALVHRPLDSIDDGMLFTAVGQINLGGPAAINNAEQSVQMASLNLTAGTKAMEMSDFSSAYSFFDHGISFLKKRHWQEHYDLSLQLFESASKCALVKGDVVSLALVSDQIIRFAKRFEDKLNTMFDKVTVLTYTSKLPEAVSVAISVLAQLGIELPETSESDLMTKLHETKILLQGFADQDLIEYKAMTDPSKIMAMKFLSRLAISLMLSPQTARPVAVPIVTLKMIQISIDHGMSPVSPIGFTYFGHHVATHGYIEEGRRYVNIAWTLLDRIGSKEFAGEVIAIGSQLLHFVSPIQVTLEFHAQGYSVAMAAGDMHGAMINSGYHVLILFWFGTKLFVCREHYSRTCRLMEQHGHINFLAHAIQFKKNIHVLMGINDGQDETSMTSSMTAKVDEILQNAYQNGTITFTFQKMYIQFMFREYDDMKVSAERFFSPTSAERFSSSTCIHHDWIMYFLYTNHTFYGGLVAFWVYRQSHDPTWAERGRTAKVKMMKWAKWSQHNFQHRVYLLDAEEAYCNNDTERAELFYEKAVSTARDHQ
jgi:predicted ATPase